MKTKKKTKKTKILLSIFLVILIIGLVVFIYFSSTKDLSQAKKQLKYIISEEWNDEKYPIGMPELIRNYSGQLKAQNIGKSINYVATKVIPNYNEKLKNADEKEVSKYFKNNSKVIEIDIGISKFDDFKALINEIKNKTSGEKLEFESYYIDENSINQFGQMTEANLYIQYKNCKEIEIAIKIYNDISNKISSIDYMVK